MQGQDMRWYSGLAGISVFICLLMTAAPAIRLLSALDGGDTNTIWMRDVRKSIRAAIPKMPEPQANQPIKYASAGMSPFARDVPDSRVKAKK
jgi:Tfp pilus assembly protein PilP